MTIDTTYTYDTSYDVDTYTMPLAPPFARPPVERLVEVEGAVEVRG